MLHSTAFTLRIIRKKTNITYGSLRIKRTIPPKTLNDYNRGTLQPSPSTKLFLQSASHYPSLAMHLSTKSGMSTNELMDLSEEGKLRFTSGDLVEAQDLDRRRFYADCEEKKDLIECCNDAGEWVPITLRSAHRFYMIYNRPPDISARTSLRIPESWVHQIPALNSSSMYAPFPKELLGYPHTSGLTILTSDLQWQKYLSVDHAGLGTQVLFNCLPGCPRDVAEATASNLRKAYRPFENTDFTFYRVSNVFDASLIDAARGDRIAGNGNPAAQYAFTVEATYFPNVKHKLVHAALKEIDNITVMCREGIDLLSTGIEMGDYRHMTAQEIEHIERAIMRIKAHVVCGHLRALEH